jgi:uncharacterized membrane protein YgdD (TMEM256/DUF423 family)
LRLVARRQSDAATGRFVLVSGFDIRYSSFLMSSTLLVRLAAALCFLAVALGAFGAHALKSTLESHHMTDVWNKAVLYHFIHAIALFVLAFLATANRGAWWLFFTGIILFSGSLYIMALTNIRWLGAITPLGGLCFLAGWAWLVVSPKGG